jgi:hypothetical protein
LVDVYTPEEVEIENSVMSPDLKQLFDLAIDLNLRIDEVWKKTTELSSEVRIAKSAINGAMGLPEGVYSLGSTEYLRVYKTSAIQKAVFKESFYTV